MSGSNGNGKKPRIDLDALSDDAGTVVIKGKEYRVHQLDGAGWKVYDEIRAGLAKLVAGEAPADVSVSTEEVYQLIQRVMPDAPSDVVWSLPTQRAGIVLHMAAQMLADVEETKPPNAAGRRRKKAPAPSSA